MRPLLPGNRRGNHRLLAIAFAAFGFGILLTFFLSPRVLVILESFVIIAVAALCLAER